jgi:5-methylcytosine-specific restriction endonuclease McrA
MKQCTFCNELKNFIEFSPDKRVSSGLQSRCKSCFAETAKQKRLLDPLKHREAVKKSREKHYEKVLERNKKYRMKNKEKVFKWKKRDRALNRARILADNAKRRSLTSGPVTKEIRAIYALRDFYVAMSLGENFHVDHIIPLSKGGKHAVYNLQVIPAKDNLRKGATL